MPEMTTPVKASGEPRTAIQSTAMIRDVRMDRDSEALLSKSLPATYRTYRKIRKHPTIALARAWAIAIVSSGEWSIEVDDDVPDDLTRFVRSQILKWRDTIVVASMAGGIDYGWTPFETVWAAKKIDGFERFIIEDIKPLLVDLTDIAVEVPGGRYAGLHQLPMQQMTEEVWLERDETLLVNWRVEGQEYYGEALLENARLPYANWQDANSAADRYDQKIAGAHWVIQYPVGKTPMDGVDVDNFTLATQFAQALQSSGAIIVPLQITRAIASMNEQLAGETAWKIELRDHAPQQVGFTARLEYLDRMLARSLLTAERSMLEGTHGTLAEADAHSDVPILIRDQENRHIASKVNEMLLRPLVRFNKGEEWQDKIRLVASPLADAKIAFFRDVFKLMMGNPSLVVDLMNQTDADALLDALDWPKSHEVANLPSINPNAATSPVPSLSVSREMAGRLQALYSHAMNMDDEVSNASSGDNGRTA